nr:hypothetical protein StreXyl84_03330 [Streptomyces sp. Xyl84]
MLRAGLAAAVRGAHAAPRHLDEEPRVRKPLPALGRLTTTVLTLACVALLYYAVLTRGRPL